MSGAVAVRADLLELTPEALTALANAGFVKRAQRTWRPACCRNWKAARTAP